MFGQNIYISKDTDFLKLWQDYQKELIIFDELFPNVYESFHYQPLNINTMSKRMKKYTLMKYIGFLSDDGREAL